MDDSRGTSSSADGSNKDAVQGESTSSTTLAANVGEDGSASYKAKDKSKKLKKEEASSGGKDSGAGETPGVEELPKVIPPWSTLPDLCWLSVFQHVPLEDMIRNVGRVCKNWNHLRREALRDRRRLYLLQSDLHGLKYIQKEESVPFIGSSLIQHVRWQDGTIPWATARPKTSILRDSLVIPGGVLSRVFVSSLLDTFPNVQHLTVMQDDIPDDYATTSFNEIIHLVSHFSRKLISLFIKFVVEETTDGEGENEATAWVLLRTIHGIPRLRRLCLSFVNPFEYDPQQVVERNEIARLAATLGRLNIFSVGYTGIEEPLLTALSQCSIPSDDTMKPLIGFSVPFKLEVMLRLDPICARKFRRLELNDFLNLQKVRNPDEEAENEEPVHFYHQLDPKHFDALRQLSALFTNLTTLELLIYTMPMSMLCRALAPLSALIYLNLKFLRPPTIEPNCTTTGQAHSLPVLPSVRLLKIRTPRILTRSYSWDPTPASHSDTENLHLAEIFPALQVLDLAYYPKECTNCGITESDIEQLDIPSKAKEEQEEEVKEEQEELVNRVKQCLKLAWQPFRRCPQLHSVRIKTFDQLNLPGGVIKADQL